MILDLDMGNSRIKWRLSGSGSGSGDTVVGRGSGDYADIVVSGAIHREIQHLSVPTGQAVKGVRVCNVAGREKLEVVQQWSEVCFGVSPEVAQVDHSVGNIRCGYRQPAKLGVDRWLAVLAAWHRLGETCVVVDAGTALTIDAILVDSKESGDHVQAAHLGGYIVPGLAMMSDALYARTEGVRAEPAVLDDLGPGVDTGAAVQRGCVAMAVALVERARVALLDQIAASDTFDIAKTGKVPVVLSGGDADCLAQYITEPVHHVPDLVLDGLAIALPEVEP